MGQSEILKILSGLVGILSIVGSVTVWLVVRMVKQYDERIERAEEKIDDLTSDLSRLQGEHAARHR